MTAEQPRLLMIYNADGGLFAMVSDAVHKVLSPSTYPCSLCAITYGATRMKSEWRAYIERLPLAVTFHHRDDFAGAHDRKAEGRLHVRQGAVAIAEERGVRLDIGDPQRASAFPHAARQAFARRKVGLFGDLP